MIDPERSFEVITNASDFALGGQLVQQDKKRRLHLIIFFLKRLYKPKLNYLIYDKELMTIIESFKE